MAWTTVGTDQPRGVVTTPGAAATPLLTYIVRAGQVGYVEFTILARNTATADWLTYVVRGAVSEAAGAATWTLKEGPIIAGSVVGLTYTVAVAAAASTVVVTVTGLVATNIEWRCAVRGEHAEN